MSKKKKNKQTKKRVDLDISPIGPWFSNYDYGSPEAGGDVSPGTGLYNGKMDKYKSVKDFINKSRKRPHRKRALEDIANNILKLANNFFNITND